MEETKKKRGIQPGTTATTEMSKFVEKQVKAANKEIFAELKNQYPGLTYQAKLKPEQIPGGIGACQPDGGIWLLDGTPIFASEAKKQGKRGNAIERWYKNPFIIYRANPSVMYATFCTGEGTAEKGPIWNTLHIAVEGDYNTIREKAKSYGMDNLSVFLSVENFDYDFVKSTLMTMIQMAINKHQK